MAFEPVGEYDLLNPPPAFRIETPRPVTRVHCVMKVDATAAAGATTKALGGGIRAFLRQIQWLRGGSPIQTWGSDAFIGAGGWTLTNVIQGWLQAVEQIVDMPAVPVVGTNLMRYSFTIPIALPPERYSLEGVNLSAVRIKETQEKAADLWTLKFKPGVIGDFLDNVGASVVNSAVIEVVAETDETLDIDTPADAMIIYSGNHAIPLSLAAQTRAPFDLPRDGLLLAQGQLDYNDSELSNDIVTKLEYVYNTREILSEESYFMQQFITALGADSSGNYPTGLNWMNWDTTYDLANAINAPAATAWQVKLDHIQPTVRGDHNEQILYMLPASIAFQRQARG
jgi:hypothetical protein